ncbi:unnamed protein product, partial [Brachionus calyciflorus]
AGDGPIVRVVGWGIWDFELISEPS